ncbi:MAG: hypothetical protein KatS3mg039_0399 [Candidatus Kapaibacterium sp.]|nr:MAG: hypothetical protein KatS3mg039_0399 [Candidatus Kapabacteria bacterium]
MRAFFGLVFVVVVGVAVAEPSWLYVRVYRQALPLVQSQTLWLGAGTTVERKLLAPEQTLRWQLLEGKTIRLTQSRRVAIENAEEPLLRTLVVRYDGELPPVKFCQFLMAHHPLVEYAEPARRQRLLSTPNDPLFSEQAYLQAIEAPAAWDVTTGSSGVLVGISDSGVRITHEDLSAAVAINTGEVPGNGLDDDGNGYPDDYRGYNLSWRDDQTAADNVVHPTNGHGTSVAGIVAAVQNNGKGISGIAPGCRIVPIKATPNATDGYILFGYESLIYAAVRGCAVVNCSWGNEDQAPSPIEESIIAYAVARDVAIVASSGNGTGTQPMYPAAYPGVLGVGETEVDGRIVPGTGIGAHCKILAPGSGARTTGSASDADYTYFSGTSSAAPMVSGVVALVRSRYRQLTALQALEHVRLSVRDISSVNPEIAMLLPGMVNARRALERDPFSTPAIVPLRTELRRLDGAVVQRGAVGDTLQVFVHAVNRLGSGSQLRWTLQVIQSWGGETDAVSVLDATVTRPTVAAGEELLIGPFSLVITRAEPLLHFFRLSVSGRGSGGADYQDVALLPFYPTADWVTIEGDSLRLSVGDYGWIGRNAGSGQELKGEGLAVRQLGSLLYGGGVFAVHFPTEQVRSGIEGDALATDNDFVPLTIVHDTNWSQRVLRDTTNSRGTAIGITLDEQFGVLDRSTIHLRTKLTNSSQASLQDIAVGYFFDFDLAPSGDSSTVSLLFQRSGACAEIMERTSRDPIAVALVRSNEQDAQLQCAGLDASYARVGNFIPERKMESLRRGTDLQFGSLGDKSIVVGARFAGPVAPAESRTMDIYVLVGRDRTELRQRAEALSAIEYRLPPEGISITPQPAAGDAVVAICPSAIVGTPTQWQLRTLDGRSIGEQTFATTPEQVVVPLSSVASGVYVLVVRSGGVLYRQRLVRLR